MTATRCSVLAVLLGLLFAGCASGGAGSLAVRASDVTVYQSVDEIEGAYDVVGVLRPPKREGYDAGRNVLDAMRREAGRRGANGLLVVDTDAEVVDSQIRAAVAQGMAFSRVQYVAVSVASPTE